MRKALQNQMSGERRYRIIGVDDEEGILDSLTVLFDNSEYEFYGAQDPVEAIELVKKEHFDLMLLDFMMTPLHGDEVVEEIRKFNKELYILLLTGHKDMAPPLETIKRLDIQGYCEKSDKFDQLQLLVESGIKSVKQMEEIKRINDKLSESNDKLEKAYLEKDGGIRKLFKTFAVNYKDRLNNYDTVTAQINNQNETYSLYQMKNLEYLAQVIDKANLYYNYIEEFYFDYYTACELEQERSETSPLDVRFMIQNHYNHINARLMADILEYYENELEYWKSCLKQIEIENIKEFE